MFLKGGDLLWLEVMIVLILMNLMDNGFMVMIVTMVKQIGIQKMVLWIQ